MRARDRGRRSAVAPPPSEEGLTRSSARRRRGDDGGDGGDGRRRRRRATPPPRGAGYAALQAKARLDQSASEVLPALAAARPDLFARCDAAALHWAHSMYLSRRFLPSLMPPVSPGACAGSGGASPSETGETAGGEGGGRTTEKEAAAPGGEGGEGDGAAVGILIPCVAFVAMGIRLTVTRRCKGAHS